MDKFHGIVGAPELDAEAGMSLRVTHRYIRIDVQSGFRSLDLAQLDGTLLAWTGLSAKLITSGGAP